MLRPPLFSNVQPRIEAWDRNPLLPWSWMTAPLARSLSMPAPLSRIAVRSTSMWAPSARTASDAHCSTTDSWTVMFGGSPPTPGCPARQRPDPSSGGSDWVPRIAASMTHHANARERFSDAATWRSPPHLHLQRAQETNFFSVGPIRRREFLLLGPQAAPNPIRWREFLVGRGGCTLGRHACSQNDRAGERMARRRDVGCRLQSAAEGDR